MPRKVCPMSSGLRLSMSSATCSRTKALARQCGLHAAVAAFGMGTWLSVNAVYVQLPLIVGMVPEGWDLATYIVLIVQVTCIFPLCYGILDWKLRHRKRWSAYNRSFLIPLMLIMEAGGLLISAFVYDSPTTIFNVKRSYALFLAFFLLSIPCTVSDVMFMPFMSRFEKANFVATFFVGMGFSALVPSATSLVQGANVNLNGTSVNPWGATEGGLLFGVRAFLVSMAAVCGISLIGFVTLLKQTKSWAPKSPGGSILRQPSESLSSTDMEIMAAKLRERSASAKKPRDSDEEAVNTFAWYILLAISLLLGAVQNSVVPVILPYATQPYGQNIYHLATSLFVMMNPIFCFLQFCVIVRRLAVFVAWTIWCLALVTFVFVVALLPVKIAWTGMGPLLCVVFAMCSGSISWQRSAIAQVLRESSTERGLFWCGAFTQIGSFIGALLIFLLSNVAHVFPRS